MRQTDWIKIRATAGLQFIHPCLVDIWLLCEEAIYQHNRPSRQLSPFQPCRTAVIVNPFLRHIFADNTNLIHSSITIPIRRRVISSATAFQNAIRCKSQSLLARIERCEEVNRNNEGFAISTEWISPWLSNIWNGFLFKQAPLYDVGGRMNHQSGTSFTNDRQFIIHSYF